MAISPLERYGIKEVADVTFYEIDSNTGLPTKPVLYLDTLKVSTIEQTAENTSARGGKGNPELITWDYNKEINVTLEDALFSPKSMAIMFGDKDGLGEEKTIRKTLKASEIITDGSDKYAMIGDKKVKITVDATNSDEDYTTFTYAVSGKKIEISPDKFPGNYYVTGDTYARRESDGVDEFFQFIMPKVKILSENTLTMEAEGDPTVFNMNLKVLKPSHGLKMMQLVQYTIDETVKDDDNNGEGGEG